MGYTHYWNIKQPLEPEKFKAFAEDVKKIKSATSVKCGIVANQYEVVVNGPCESLVIQLNDSGFDFCKTNRYDYDVVVTATLLLAKRHFADAILLSSDGLASRWQSRCTKKSPVKSSRDERLRLAAYSLKKSCTTWPTQDALNGTVPVPGLHWHLRRVNRPRRTYTDLDAVNSSGNRCGTKVACSTINLNFLRSPNPSRASSAGEPWAWLKTVHTFTDRHNERFTCNR